MINDWRAFLENNGAEYSKTTPSRIETFGNPRREQHLVLNGNTLCDLSHFGLIKAEGEEAELFLQNQLSNDIKLIDAEHSQLDAYCTPKGRMLAIMRIFKRHDQYILRTPEELVENLLKRMSMFIMMTKVTLGNAHEGLIRFGYAGPDAEQELENAVGGFPQTADQVLDQEDLTIIRIPGTLPRFEIYAEFEHAQKLWDKLNVRGTPVGAPAWQLLDILNGLPDVFSATVEAFVPQMVNLQLVNGVSFKKGCYPGQEIVARMHYLGKLKRRMYRLHITSDEIPPPGLEICTLGHNEPIGSIVSAAPHPSGGTEALAVLTIKFVDDKAPLHLEKPGGAEAIIKELPYSFETA